ncbi:LuxR family transcriptional regulator [Mycobacterium sp. URHB0044]|uniref:helix-turn-helix transcriptional regulator n=1 Tax=Mycobacterium sp. URHB0044 TaxID=1380386 RepID=UPI00055B3C7C|nr:LuxR family transcriptional regulator [Mycobacterium sp. URHB0044]
MDGQLLGRERECAAIDQLLVQVREGRSGVLMLRGEPGIGKTALLRHMSDRTTGFTTLRCTGVESAMELPFAGLHELCSPLLTSFADLPESQRVALTVSLGLAAGPSPDRLQVALATLGLLAAAAEQKPVLCVIEDAHWLDQASAQVLGFVGRRLLAEPVGLVFAARPPVTMPDPLAGLPELGVDGLDTRSSGELLRSAGTVTVDEDVRARIIDETRGNPLALLELGATMGAASFAGGFATLAGTSLSARIEDEYLARLSDLPRDTQRLVLLAAADPAGDVTLIHRAAASLHMGIDAADSAVDAGLLAKGGTLRFRHPLLRSGVYRAASVDERRTAHGALAAATDGDVDPDRRAWHRAYAASAADEEVAAELIGSAGRAHARGGAAAAAAFLERAVALTPEPGDRAPRALAAAEAKFAVGDLQAAAKLLAQAESGPLGAIDRAKVDLIRGAMAFTQYRGGDAPALLFKAAKGFQPLDLELARLTYLQALIAAGYAGRLGDSDLRVRIARAAQALPLDPEPIPATHLLVHGIATWLSDGYVAAAPALKEAVRRHRSAAPDPGVVGFAFNVMAMHLCDDVAWYEMVIGQVDLARESGMLSWLPLALDSLAEFYVHAGEFARAEALVAEVDRIDPVVAAATAPRIAFLIAAWRGDAPAARGALEAVVESAEDRGEGWALTYAEYGNAVLHNGLADYAAAADDAEYPSASFDLEPGYTVRALFELVEAATRCGHRDRAELAAERMSAVAAASGGDYACAMDARCRAMLTDGDAAEELYREAIERFSRTRMAVLVARSRLSYGEWLRRQNRRIDARKQLKPAYEALAQMGANGFAARAHAELEATGEKVRRRSVPSSGELTPQEEQIAQLARRRRTNPEIGAQLFLSPRTVEWHLRNIFAKLEIGSRREIDTALARRKSSLLD